MKKAPSPLIPGLSYYDSIVRLHWLATYRSRMLGHGVAHKNPAFLPFHRKLIGLLEDGMRVVSQKQLTLPYWDWTDESSVEAIFTDEFMGPQTGDPDEDYAITSGHFRKGSYELNLVTVPIGNDDPANQCPFPFLTRAVGSNVIPPFEEALAAQGKTYFSLPTEAQVEAALEVPTYDAAPWNQVADINKSFRNHLEGNPTGKSPLQTLHNLIHTWVAGSWNGEQSNLVGKAWVTSPQIYVGSMLALEASPNDPVFWLHHCNVDRIWAVWERSHPDSFRPISGATEGFNLHDEIYPYGEYPSELMIRSTFVDFTGDPFETDTELDAVRYVSDGLLVIDGEKIAVLGPYDEISGQHPDLEIAEYPDRIVMPGFVDTHVHYPQTEVIAAYGEQLLEWLNKYIFATEIKLKDPAYASEVAIFFLDQLVSRGTTTAQVFTTTFPHTVDIFFEEAASRNLLMIAGITGIDREGTAPDGYRDTADGFYNSSKELIEKWHNNGRQRYAVTPRFAFGSTKEQLAYCGELMQEYDTWANTHLCENPEEVAGVAEFFPESSDYLNVYEQAGIMQEKFTAGHSIHITESMIERMGAARATISFCPRSNLFLGSGLLKINEVMSRPDHPLMSTGTDMGGGNSFSMLPVLDEAYKVCALQDFKLSAWKAYYRATTGGAKALWLDDQIGSFDPGKYADLTVLNPAATPTMKFRVDRMDSSDEMENVHQRLFGMMAMGDDRAVDATYVAGERLFSRV